MLAFAAEIAGALRATYDEALAIVDRWFDASSPVEETTPPSAPRANAPQEVGLDALLAESTRLRGALVSVDVAMLASEGCDWGFDALDARCAEALQRLPVTVTLSTRTETTDVMALKANGAAGADESATVPLRAWFETGWRAAMCENAERLRSTLAGSLARGRSEVAQAIRVLDYHVLSAERSLEDDGEDDSEEMIAAGIDRTRALLSAARAGARNRAERALRGFVSDASATTSTFCAPVVGHRPHEITNAMLGTRSTEPPPTTLRSVATTLLERTGPVVDAVLRDTREVVSGRRHVEHVDHATAFLAVDIGEATRGLPAAYRRLFSPTPTELIDVYVSRPDLEARCASALDSWRRGRPEVLWIVGDRGAGRRTLLSRWVSRMRVDEALAWVRLDTDTRTEEALARQLAASLELPPADRLTDVQRSFKTSSTRRIAVLDAIDRIFVPDGDGLERINALLELMAHTSNDTLWIAIVSRSTAEFLRRDGLLRVLPTSTCDVGPMPRSEIRSLIELRHALSGMSLEFETSPSQVARLASTPTFATLVTASRRASAADAYFERLSEISFGNPQHAMACWLLSASRSERDASTLLINPLPEALPQFTNDLRVPELHALALAARVERLRTADLATYLNAGAASTESLLASLEARGLLTRAPKRPECVSLPRLRAPAIVHELRRRGLL